MGYRSDVILFMQEKAYNKLIEICKEMKFEPDYVYYNEVENNYKVNWDWVKWYADFPEVNAIEKLLTSFAEKDKDSGYDFKKFIVGEDECYEEETHGDTFNDIFIKIEIVCENENDYKIRKE